MEVYQLVLKNSLRITASYLPGALNVKADQLSCQKAIADYKSPKDRFSHLLEWALIKPVVELFASERSHQLEGFISRKGNALFVGMAVKGSYGYPPACLFPHVISLASARRLHHPILVTPQWENQLWLLILLKQSLRLPPKLSHALLDPQVKQNFLPCHPCLANLLVWELSLVL
jgi:hypothetical protein